MKKEIQVILRSWRNASLTARLVVAGMSLFGFFAFSVTVIATALDHPRNMIVLSLVSVLALTALVVCYGLVRMTLISPHDQE